MSKNGHFLYLFVNLPFVWWVKIGITGRSVARRARQVDKAAPGIPFPIGFMFWPFFARPVEKALHSFLSPLNARYYRGDGSTEWFWALAAPVYWAVMAVNWAGWGLFLVWAWGKIFAGGG